MDLPISRDDLATFRDMLARFGDLTKIERDGETEYVYRNASGRAGYDVPPGLANEPGRPLSPMALDEILRSEVWNDYIFRDAEFSWQTSLLEPVGGMDNFFKGFLRQPRAAAAAAIGRPRPHRRQGHGDRGGGATRSRSPIEQGGKPRTLSADFCICTIPDADLRDAENQSAGGVTWTRRAKLPVQAAGKVGWQAERFWETKDQIYGGISWTTDVITQIWYPSSGFLSRKGALTGAYMYGAAAERFNAQPVAERLRQAKEQGDKLHDGYSKYVEHGVAIGWNNMEFERMGWADEGDPSFAQHAQVLSTPQGRFHMAGDQLTYWSGWQEGALISAFEAVKSIDRQAAAPRLTAEVVPDFRSELPRIRLKGPRNHWRCEPAHPGYATLTYFFSAAALQSPRGRAVARAPRSRAGGMHGTRRQHAFPRHHLCRGHARPAAAVCLDSELGHSCGRLVGLRAPAARRLGGAVRHVRHGAGRDLHRSRQCGAVHLASP